MVMPSVSPMSAGGEGAGGGRDLNRPGRCSRRHSYAQLCRGRALDRRSSGSIETDSVLTRTGAESTTVNRHHRARGPLDRAEAADADGAAAHSVDREDVADG